MPGTLNRSMSCNDNNTSWGVISHNAPYDANGNFSRIINTASTVTFETNKLTVSGNVAPVLSAAFDLINSERPAGKFLSNTAVGSFGLRYEFTLSPATGPASPACSCPSWSPSRPRSRCSPREACCSRPVGAARPDTHAAPKHHKTP